MKILFIADIVGEPGRKAVKKILGSLKQEYAVDFTIANGEHLSDRVGVDAEIVEEMKEAGIDFFTTGNHVWRQKDFAKHIDRPELPIIRPANFVGETPGEGYHVVTTPWGNLLVVNLLGQHDIKANLTNPFTKMDEILSQITDYKYSLVDFHAEMSSEKVALGRYLDGRVSAVVGTHTHVPTADNRVLSGGTAVVSDVGFVGPMESVLGVKDELIFNTFISSMPQKFEIAEGPVQFNAAVIDLDKDGKATSIIRVDRIVSV
jgi:metallophosphoesterase (TIGR00282 family)